MQIIKKARPAFRLGLLTTAKVYLAFPFDFKKESFANSAYQMQFILILWYHN